MVKVFVNNDINVYNNSIMTTLVINSITSNKNLCINDGLLIDNISLSTISIFNYYEVLANVTSYNVISNNLFMDKRELY